VRNDLVHEKAMEIAEKAEGEFYLAQREARNAISFVKRVAELLRQDRSGN